VNKTLLFITAVLFLLLLTGCGATTSIDEYRPNNSVMELNGDESVVILGRRDAGHYDTDREFISCVASRMKGADISVMPEQQFIDAIYPWFEPRTAPKGLKRLTRLMQDPDIKSQVDRQRVRYLVWLDGSTQTHDQGGSISCAIGPGGGGCFGYAQWEKSSVYEAIVWDLNDAVAPIPLLTPVKKDACNSLGKELKQFFSVEK
jgi:hypothetical protein